MMGLFCFFDGCDDDVDASFFRLPLSAWTEAYLSFVHGALSDVRETKSTRKKKKKRERTSAFVLFVV